jgi:DNA-binding LacI/PurR family transcriptional regulator
VPPTLKDVARRAGVSYSTVSRVLAGKPHVRADVAARVTAAAEALGYVPDRRARSLKTRRNDTLGVIVSDVRREFFAPVVRAIEDVASARGFAVLLCNADDDADKEARYADLLLEETVAGAIVAATGDRSRAALRLVGGGIPVVTIDRRVAGSSVDSVTVDNVGGARAAVAHLLAQGYRRVALLAGLRVAGTAQARRRGFEEAHAEAGVPIDPDLLRDELREAADAQQAADELLTASRPPDALFTTNSRLATGVLQALRHRGLRSGHDLGFATFDDPTWATLLDPPLTCVAQPSYEVGRHAAVRLFDRIDGPVGPVLHQVLPTELRVRGSSLALAFARHPPPLSSPMT